MSSNRRTRRTTRRAVSALAVITALASAAPIAEASAASNPLPLPSLPGLGSLPAFTFSPPQFTVPPGVAFAQGPTVIGQTFTGDTTVCVSAVVSHCSP
jgi:hypothetical protein